MAENGSFFVAGVLHLPPLPGAPACEGSFQAVVDHALRDAEALLTGGIRSVVVENFGDAPFFATAVPPHVSAMMSVIGARIRADAANCGTQFTAVSRNGAIDNSTREPGERGILYG